MSERIHATSAERQRAYRERQREGPATAPRPAVRKGRRRSRPARLLALADAARELSEEYGNWLEMLPTNLANGQTAAQLADVIAQLDQVADVLEAIEPPAVGR